MRTVDAYDGACCFALTHDKERAFAMLGRAMDHGYYNAEHLKVDSDLTPLHEDPQWQIMMARAVADEASYPRQSPQ